MDILGNHKCSLLNWSKWVEPANETPDITKHLNLVCTLFQSLKIMQRWGLLVRGQSVIT